MRTICLLFGLFAICFMSMGNGSSIDSVSVQGNYRLRVFVSLPNAWWTPNDKPYNHNALWLFGKLKESDVWQHLDLSTDSSSYASDADLHVFPSRDGKGVFIRRSKQGSGSLNRLWVDLSTKDPLPKNAFLDVFSIEMVYVKTESFEVGDSSSIGHLGTGNTLAPFRIDSESSIQIGLGSNQLAAKDSKTLAGNVPKAYPKGYTGFYAMRYEFNQAIQASFLNSLAADQLDTHLQLNELQIGISPLGSDPLSSRNGLIAHLNSDGSYGIANNADWDGLLNEEEDGLGRAANRMNWSLFTALLDWSALRPMSELEFEKACRGPIRAVKGEFAWGTAELQDAEQIILDGTPYETVLDSADGNKGLAAIGNYDPKESGVLRNGFASSKNSSRLSAGASYYGLMEMSGNVFEQVINLSAEGLKFRGKHGDGNLDADGYSDVSDWCPRTGNCAGIRGGGYQSGVWQEFRDAAVSDRYYIDFNPNSIIKNTIGGRGVRSN